MRTIITKIFAFLLAAAVCASFAACSQSEPENDIDNNNSDSTSNSPLINVAGDDDEQSDEDDTTDGTDEGDGEETDEDVTAPEEDTTTPEENAAPEGETEGDADDEDEVPERDEETETTVITPEEEQSPVSYKGEAIAETVRSAVGYDFLFGGDSPEEGGFDNSGVIYYALTKNGISCPRMLGEIVEIGTEVGYDELISGDLVFFRLDDGSNTIFGGVYVGGGNAVMSFSEGIPVKLVDITTTYYRSNFVFGKRVAS